jgi:hypothetical protein
MTPAKLYQIANIPLERPEYPTRVTEIKGCRFLPPVFLSMGRLYLIVVTFKKWWTPKEGFYHVPAAKYATWISRFVLKAQSADSESGGRCFIFECYEGTPPIDAQPFRYGEKGRKIKV